MGKIHDLVALYGRQGARQRVSGDEWRCVHVAAAVLAEESNGIAFSHPAFCYASLPHRKVRDAVNSERGGDALRLSSEPLTDADGWAVPMPYGSRARLVLLYLQTKAVLHGTRDIQLGPSLNSWMQDMGLTVGGRSYELFRTQIRSILASNLAISHGRGSRSIRIIEPMYPAEERLCDARVTLGEDFFHELQSNYIVLWQPTFKFIGSQSLSIDIYLWLSGVLPRLAEAISVSWMEVYARFGDTYKNLFQFKPRFTSALSTVLATYPDARVSVSPRSGLLLEPSHPPVREEGRVRVGGSAPGA